MIKKTAKDIVIRTINANVANTLMRKLHYSRKVVNNSQLHLGVLWEGKIEGVMQFGPSMVKKNLIHLVKNTEWNEFIELNRMAFSDKLPRNSESRAIGIALRLIKRNYPFIKWVISFADGTQCGDGTIYRASGFVLTGIKKNASLAVDPLTGKIIQKIAAYHQGRQYAFKSFDKLPGFQFRYIYFIDKTMKDHLTVPIIPFSKIKEMGADMYKGKKCGGLVEGQQKPSVDGGATPTSPLHNK